VRKVSIMMGTPANKDIFKNTGMFSNEFDSANPNDICIAVDTEDPDMLRSIGEDLEAFISDLSSKSKDVQLKKAKSLRGALDKLKNPNLALVSIPGEYVFDEGKRLLDENMNLFIFSDNMGLEEEKNLKEAARDKGLIVMGPDCGTGIISGVPLAFANVVNKGNIGVVGASGTGIQEVSSIISRLGGGISHAIGIGGRDLTEEVGGISARIALDYLAKDKDTEVIVFISKPPAEAVKNSIVEKLKAIGKTAVALFLGEDEKEPEANVHFSSTLEDTANLAFYLSRKKGVYKGRIKELEERLDLIRSCKYQKGIHGYYGGGTLAGEAKLILRKHMEKPGNKIIDFGDDEYTKGRPHPMIDPGTRKDAIRGLRDDESVAVVIFDNVIGYGSSTDMAGSLGPKISELLEHKRKNGRDIIFIASVCGTEDDPQVYSKQVEELEKAGVIVMSTNAQCAKLADEIMEYLNGERKQEDAFSGLLGEDLRIINVGLESFGKTLYDQDVDVVQYNWTPMAGGNKDLQRMLRKLENI